MRKTVCIEFETPEELLRAFNVRREPGDFFPVLTGGIYVVNHVEGARLAGVGSDGYVLGGFTFAEFVAAAFEKCGVRTKPPEDPSAL